MDKIRIDFFDILGYLVPGSAFLMICWIAADNQVKSIWQIYQSVHSVDKKTIFIGLFLSYILGFTLHALGRFLFDVYQKKIHSKKNMSPNSQLNKPEIWALIRENGEKHISILERWYALRALSQNLSAASLLCVSICLYKWRVFGYFEWSFLALGFMIFFIVFMEKSFVFNQYLNDDIDATIQILNKA
jgi:hypothetical protein